MGGFNNPVAGGAGGALVRQAIKSPNYSAGVSGWTVNQDGSAEFRDVTIAGDDVSLLVKNGNRELELNVASGGTYDGYPHIRINPDISQNEDGLVLAVTDEFTGQASLIIVSPYPDGGDVTDATQLILVSSVNPGSGDATFTVSSGAITLQAAGDIALNSTGGNVTVSGTHQTGAVLVEGDWNALTLNAGYSARAGSYAPAYRWLGPETIQLRGTIDKGTGAGGAGVNGFANGDQPFTMPGGSPAPRPAALVHKAVACQERAANYATARLDIGSGGVCTFRTSAAHDPGWVDLGDWTFSTD